MHRRRRGRRVDARRSRAGTALETGGERREIDLRCGGIAERDEILGDPSLLAPVAVEVQPRADEPERAGRSAVRRSPTATSALAATARDPLDRRRPRQQAEIDRLLGFDRRGVGDGLEVDEDVTEPGCADGECGREHHLGSDSPASLRPRGDVDVGAREHTDAVELEQRRLRAYRDPGIEPIAGASGTDTLIAATLRQGRRSAHRRARRRAPREHAARRPVGHRGLGAGHPAQEQIQDAREVRVRVVAGQAPAQIAMQRDGVEQGLKAVVGALISAASAAGG